MEIKVNEYINDLETQEIIRKVWEDKTDEIRDKYNALVKTVDSMDNEGYAKVLSVLDEIPTPALMAFRKYLENNQDKHILMKKYKQDFNQAVNAKFKHFRENKNVDNDLNILLGKHHGVKYNALDNTPVYLNFTNDNLEKDLFNLSNHWKNDNREGFSSEFDKIRAFQDFIAKIGNDDPVMIERMLKNITKEEMGIVFLNKLDLDYAAKTTKTSNCDRFFDGKVQEQGILTTIMLAYQDVNEQLTMERLNDLGYLCLEKNPEATHESGSNAKSNSNPDFALKGTNTYVELQTKAWKEWKIKSDFNPDRIEYKGWKHTAYNNNIDKGRQLYHVESVLNITNYSKNYLKNDLYIYDVTAIYKALKEHPSFATGIKEYVGKYDGIKVDVKGLENACGRTLHMQITDGEQLNQFVCRNLSDKELTAVKEYASQRVEDIQIANAEKINRTFEAFIPILLEFKGQAEGKIKDMTLEDLGCQRQNKPLTLGDKINAAKNKQTNKSPAGKQHKEKERE